jgi:hypothetical protein
MKLLRMLFSHFMFIPLLERPSLMHVRETIECPYLCLFMYLFNDVIGSSVFIASNDRTISELERSW